MAIINFLDIETTGFFFKQKDRIVEFANIQYDAKENKIINEETFMVNPEIFIPQKVSDIHGIYNKDVNHLPNFEKYSDRVSNIMNENSYIAGHNIDRFDIPFILQELLRYNTNIPKNFFIIDTFLLAKKFMKTNDKISYSLDNLCKYYGIDLSARVVHDALVDCRLTIELFNKLRQEYDMTNDLIFVDDDYILSKKLNYDLCSKKEIILPKYLDAFENDKKILDYVKNEKPLLPWINRRMNFIDYNLSDYTCDHLNEKYIPIISITTKYKVITQQILIDFLIEINLLNNNKLPTIYSLENDLVRFKVKQNNNQEIIYIAFNKEHLYDHFSENKEVLKQLKIKSVTEIKNILSL